MNFRLPKQSALATLCILAGLLCARAPLQAAQPADGLLLEAATAGDPSAVQAALASGADVDVRDGEGRSALMIAAASGNFSATRLLVWAGANPAATTTDGRTIYDLIPSDVPDRQPIVLLLRCQAFLREHGKVAAGRVAKPSLTLIMEDNVNYLHRRIKAAYEVNQAELHGKPGVDDDHNGFVDDVYGWDVVPDRPYAIRQEQLDAYLRNREAIARIMKVDTDRREGRLTADQAELELAGYTNPLALIMGPHPQLTDRNFLDLVKSSAHGSHVAGIVLDNSDDKARLLTVAVPGVGNIARPFGPRTEEVLAGFFRESSSPEDFLKRCRARLLSDCFELGRRYSRYVGATGAGVANLSFGYGYPYAEQVTNFLLRRYVAERHGRDAAYAPEEDDLKALLGTHASEIYLALSSTWATVFYENPDVLFVCAAGNETQDNDESYCQPAYFSRFFPNVITVASVGPQGSLSSFSNFGRHSVNVAAFGEGILSTVIPEASIYMDGTSMAAPAVAGTAAFVRSLQPSLGAAELRRLIEYTATSGDQLKEHCTSGGAVDREALRLLFQGTPAQRTQVRAGMTLTALIYMDSDSSTQANLDADRFSAAALRETPEDARACHARALFLDCTGKPEEARQLIDRSVKLDAPNRHFWSTRAVICEHQGDLAAAIASLTQALILATADNEVTPGMRASLLARRALVRLKHGDRDLAVADTKAALVAVPDAVLVDELMELVR